MAVEPLVIGPVDVVDGARIVRLVGELDIATGPQLAAVLDACDGTTICVDITGVTFVDSSGLAVLARAHRHAGDHEAALTVQNAAPNVRKVFEITNLDFLLDVDRTGTT